MIGVILVIINLLNSLIFVIKKNQWLVLAHISEQNNTKELALNTIKNFFPYDNKILVADQDEGSIG